MALRAAVRILKNSTDTVGYPEMSYRLPYALLCTLLFACADRALGDHPAEYDPATDLRTRAEILHDYCDLYARCKPNNGFSEDFGCEEFFEWEADLFDSLPAKQPPRCGQVLYDIYACASLANSCEDFNSAYDLDDADTRCDEPRERFYELNCTA